MSNADYHASEGISKSGLDRIKQSPAHYYARYLDQNRPPEEPTTQAQLNGTLAHCTILEPAEFGERYRVGPDVSKATNEWKTFAKSMPYGCIAIKPEQFITAHAQRASVLTIPDLAEGLELGMPEVSAFWTDEETGVLCKCRPDFVQDCGKAGVILIDVKTCGNASPSEFSRMIAKHRYHVQAAYYSDGFAIASGRNVLGFIFAAVEMDYPFAASAIALDEESIEQGRRDYRRNIDTYAECLSAGIWPGYGQDVQIARLPNWSFDNDEEISIGYV